MSPSQANKSCPKNLSLKVSEGEERERTNSTRVHSPDSDIAVSATHEAEWVYNASASAYRVLLTSMSDNWIGVGFSGSCKSE